MKSDWNRRDIQLEIIRFVTQERGKVSIRELANNFAMEEFEMLENLETLSKRGQVEYDAFYVWLVEPGSFRKSDFETYFA